MDLLALADQSIRAALSGKEFSVKPEGEKLGCFVTINKQGSLRGCIGYVQSQQPLSQTLTQAAVAAALHDPRFPPLTLDEYETCNLEISILSVPKALHKNQIESIIPGTHGIIISKASQSGLLLPQVFSQETSIHDMLSMTCQKAGLPAHAWKEKSVHIHIFTVRLIH